MSQDTTQLTPGLEQTVSQVYAGLSSSASANGARQGEAEAFLRENGVAAVRPTSVTAGQKTGG